MAPLVEVLRHLLVLELNDQVETIIDLLSSLLYLYDGTVVKSLILIEIALDFVIVYAMSQVID